MEPWTYTDGDNGELLIDSCNPGEVTVQTQGNGSVACVMADDLPEVVGKLYEACGLPPRVILPRPDISLPADGAPLRCGDISLRTHEDGISVGLPGITAAAISPDALRQRAAFMAAYADAVETEPVPADVDGLAAVLMQAHSPGAMGLDGARPMARTALRWMRDREARDA